MAQAKALPEGQLPEGTASYVSTSVHTVQPSRSLSGHVRHTRARASRVLMYTTVTTHGSQAGRCTCAAANVDLAFTFRDMPSRQGRRKTNCKAVLAKSPKPTQAHRRGAALRSHFFDWRCNCPALRLGGGNLETPMSAPSPFRRHPSSGTEQPVSTSFVLPCSFKSRQATLRQPPCTARRREAS